MTDPVATTLATYDVIADDYARRNAVSTDDVVAKQELFAASVGAGGLVADVGCGPGRDAAWFAARGLRVVGVDGSVSMISRARDAGVTAVRGDLRRLPVRDGVLDGVWSSASLLHVPRDDVPATLREWRRCLRLGGALGLSTSLGGREGWEVVPYVTTSPGPEPFVRWFVHHDREPLLALIANAGFVVHDAVELVASRHWFHVLAVATAG